MAQGKSFLCREKFKEANDNFIIIFGGLKDIFVSWDSTKEENSDERGFAGFHRIRPSLRLIYLFGDLYV